MNRELIITLPRYDPATEYLSQFSRDIIKEAEDNNIKLKRLKGKDSNKNNFEKVINKLNYNMIMFNGHGSDKTIMGHDDESLIILGKNEHLITERIIYARACNAANTLGKECIKNTKNGCFIGYNVNYMFYTDTNWDLNPLKDNIAKMFLDSSNIIPISLIKGNSAEEADKKSKNQILKNINKVLKNKNQESFMIAEALWNNYVGQVVLGNKDIKF